MMKGSKANLTKAMQIVDLIGESAEIKSYLNFPVSVVNNHVVRLSIMTNSYHWHYHPDSDETFLGIEGVLCIDLEDRTVELYPQQLFTVPAGVIHRTRPMHSRSVNLTFELEEMETVEVTR